MEYRPPAIQLTIDADGAILVTCRMVRPVGPTPDGGCYECEYTESATGNRASRHLVFNVCHREMDGVRVLVRKVLDEADRIIREG